jgi:hypothetical protein
LCVFSNCARSFGGSAASRLKTGASSFTTEGPGDGSSMMAWSIDAIGIGGM